MRPLCSSSESEDGANAGDKDSDSDDDASLDTDVGDLNQLETDEDKASQLLNSPENPQRNSKSH